MSTPTPAEPAPGGVAALVKGVRKLTESVDAMRVQLAVEKKRSRRWRIASMLTAIGLALDLGLTGAVINGYVTQKCLDSRSDHFFHYEKDKVIGQIAGIDLIIPMHKPSEPPRPADPVAGVKQFRAASEKYIERIDALPGC